MRAVIAVSPHGCDSTAALLSRGHGSTPPPATHRHALALRIQAFIHQRLGDPGLCPGTIAAAHQISLRYLYKIFHEQGVTVAAWIRQQRLEHCHRDLADPYLAPLPVYAIATRWGFTNSAHFSRAFRAAYGVAPKEYRDITAQRIRAVRKTSTSVQGPSTTH